MNRSLIRHLSLEQLERREVLSVTFVEAMLYTDSGGVSSVYASDWDGDGDVDVAFDGPVGLGWHENIDGKGGLGPQQMISNDVSHASWFLLIILPRRANWRTARV